MRKVAKRDHSEMVGGQDSFLDIVANLVGILIILVVVVGAQANFVRSEVASTKDLDDEIAQRKLALKQSELIVTKLIRDNHDLEAEIREEQKLTAKLADERHAKLMQIEMVRQEIASRTQDWDEFKKTAFDKQVAVDSLREQLTVVHRQLRTWQITDETRVETIEHFPTPIAKTVFTDEVHYRLAGGRIAQVPMELLIDQMKSQWKVVAENLSNSNHAIETIAPIDGFRLQYELVKKVVTRETELGVMQGEAVEFDHFVIIPEREIIGEQIDQALFQKSDFLSGLLDRRPEKTTISIWVYPDSYKEFSELKSWLHRRGFQIASWPLDEGRPISGGPNGFKTSAQ